MRKSDIAWAAGLFEGEGSCHIAGTRNRQPVVQLSMTDEDVVRRFAYIVGCGNVRGYKAQSSNRKDYWGWSVQGREDVLHVLGLLWPFLGERRQQAATELIERAVRIGDWKGFCQKGHGDLGDPAIGYVHKKTGKLHCRVCRKDRNREYRERRRVSRHRASA